MSTIEKGRESEVFTVATKVIFAAAGKPFEHEYTSTTPASDVLTDAMRAFEISTDGTTRYYLLHGGVEVAADQRIGALADEHASGHDRRQLVLKLRTETVSG